jgi:two-component system chemotaxis response regulator CheB
VRIVPSIDRMMSSAALAMGSQVMGVVLTGMGSDGAAGVRTIAAAGGVAVAESDATAVIFGMPEEAIRTGVVESVLPLGQMAAAIERFAWRCARRDRGAGG